MASVRKNSLVIVLLAAMVLGILLGEEALPHAGEPLGVYASRVANSAVYVAEALYVQALANAYLMFTGSTGATVRTKATGEAGLDFSTPAREEQDPLKQRTAKNEGEINDQQRLSVQAYKEAVGADSEDAPMVLPEHPDDVRKRMGVVDRDGPEMKCNQEIPNTSSVTTRNVELRATSTFQGQHGGQYSWKYEIHFKNHGTETVQMLTRHWIFVDSKGNLISEVKGPGARGVTPVLVPGGEWSYESGSSLATKHGSMYGSFQFEVLKASKANAGEPSSFSGRVGRLLLTDRGGKPRRVPCTNEAADVLLPTTSVLSVERVIIGGTSTFHKKKGKKYVFSYDVQFNNARDDTIKVIGHSWEVVDETGKRTVVSRGGGVGGVYKEKSRELEAGDAFRSQGELTSTTSKANAQGTYRVLVTSPDGSRTEIEARTDFMALVAERGETHAPNFVVDPSFR